MGKSKKTTVGYWYLPAYHAGLGIGPIDAFLEFRGGDKPAWKGELTESGTININAPELWGGEKDQGGIVGAVDVMFGEATQQPNQYLIDTFGAQQSAWRGLSTLVFKGGKYGAMNPYPQKASYKIRKITKGWDNDNCWYAAKAEVPMGSTPGSPLAVDSDGWEYCIRPQEADPGHTNLTPPETGWAPAQAPFGEGGSVAMPPNTNWPLHTVLWARRVVSIPSGSWVLRVQIENGAIVLIDGVVAGAVNAGNIDIVNLPIINIPIQAGDHLVEIKGFDEVSSGGTVYLGAWVEAVAFRAMNPAHILYYSRTQADMGREPAESIDEASFTAAADWFYSQGFGLCTSYDPSTESVEEFEQRICRVAGCSLTRSLLDGKWYLDIANGEYVLADLPILTDDDILEFEQQPTLLDSAVNSVSIKYFDPERKEAIVTPPVQAPALISDFGTNHLNIEYLEIPEGGLATRVAQRELQARITPLSGFPLKTTRKPYAWRPSTYFRLQVPKRGIADMVCIFSEKSSGQLRSGAMSISATQDVYSVPAASFVEVEPGVDTSPAQTPEAILHQLAFEAPYIEVAATLSRADLAALPEETGFLMAVAANPANNRDYAMMVDAGAGYEHTANGDWCATAVVVEPSGFDDSSFTLTNGLGLGAVETGMPAIWGSEVVRVDALDPGTGAVSFGRSCADTVPVKHAAGERIWFYAVNAAADLTEYTDGETVLVKLLPNAGGQQLPLVLATAMSATFEGRCARPYPPGQFRVNGLVDPYSLTGEITVSGVHRDRVQQADQLIDGEMPGIGPEPGTTYTVRYILNGALVHTDAGLVAPSSSYTPSGGGWMRVEMEAVRDGLSSYQMHVREFSLGQPLLAEDGSLITTEDNDPIIMG